MVFNLDTIGVVDFYKACSKDNLSNLYYMAKFRDLFKSLIDNFKSETGEKSEGRHERLKGHLMI